MSIPVRQQLDLGSQKIINLLDPTLAQDAATKNYSDSVSTKTVVLTAGENISSYHAVVCIGGMAYNADASTVGHAGRVIGVAITSASLGAAITVQLAGEADNAGFAFTAGNPVFLGTGGALVQTPATGTAFEQQLGIALSVTSLVVSLNEVILFA